MEDSGVIFLIQDLTSEVGVYVSGSRGRSVDQPPMGLQSALTCRLARTIEVVLIGIALFRLRTNVTNDRKVSLSR